MSPVSALLKALLLVYMDRHVWVGQQVVHPFSTFRWWIEQYSGTCSNTGIVVEPNAAYNVLPDLSAVCSLKNLWKQNQNIPLYYLFHHILSKGSEHNWNHTLSWISTTLFLFNSITSSHNYAEVCGFNVKKVNLRGLKRQCRPKSRRCSSRKTSQPGSVKLVSCKFSG